MGLDMRGHLGWICLKNRAHGRLPGPEREHGGKPRQREAHTHAGPRSPSPFTGKLEAEMVPEVDAVPEADVVPDGTRRRSKR